MSEGLRTQQANRVLNAINRGEISATQGLKALQFSRLEKSRGRTWLPLWLRFAFRTRGREIRLLIPLIVIGPLILVFFIAFLPLAALGVIFLRRHEIWGTFGRILIAIFSLSKTLLFYGRGMGVRVKNRETEVGFWLS